MAQEESRIKPGVVFGNRLINLSISCWYKLNNFDLIFNKDSCPEDSCSAINYDCSLVRFAPECKSDKDCKKGYKCVSYMFLMSSQYNNFINFCFSIFKCYSQYKCTNVCAKSATLAYVA